MKTLFKSKTIVFNLVLSIAGVVAYFYPPATEIVQSNSVLILSIIGVCNIALRRVTKDAYSFFPLVLACLCCAAFVSCADYKVGFEGVIRTDDGELVITNEGITGKAVIDRTSGK